MNWLDWVLVVIVVLSAWRGLMTGFIAGIARLLGLVLGLAAAFTGYKTLALYLDRQWNWGDAIATFILERFPQVLLQDAMSNVLPGNPWGQNPGDYLPDDMITGYATMAAKQMAASLLELFSFAVLALVVYILVILIMQVLSGVASHSLLNPLDRLGGLALGLVRGTLVVIIITALLTPLLATGVAGDGENAGFLGRAVAGSLVMPYAQGVADFLKLQFPGWPPFNKPARFI